MNKKRNEVPNNEGKHRGIAIRKGKKIGRGKKKKKNEGGKQKN